MRLAEVELELALEVQDMVLSGQAECPENPMLFFRSPMNIHEDFEDGDCELKDGYLEYQGMLELQRDSEWLVSCPNCGDFGQIQKSDPVLCPICQSPNIETEHA